MVSIISSGIILSVTPLPSSYRLCFLILVSSEPLFSYICILPGHHPQRDPEWDGRQHQGASGQGDGGDQAEEQAADHHAGRTWITNNTNVQVCLLVSVPVIVYLSSQASQSMRQSSRIFDEQVLLVLFLDTITTTLQVEDLNYEKRKTDGLLQQLLPVDIIAQLKAGEQPPPKCFSSSSWFLFLLSSPILGVFSIWMFENYPLYTHYTANANPRMYENTTLFFGDIVGFTKLTAQRWKRFRCWGVDHFHMLLQHCHPNNPILERSLQQVWQSHWQLWCLQGMTSNRKWPQIVSFNGKKEHCVVNY